MADTKVMSAGAVKSMVAALGAEYERDTGNKLDLNFGTAGSLRDRIKGGEAADLVILSQTYIADLAKLGFVVPDSAIDLGRTVTGVVVREGASIPDISTPEAFKRALLNARLRRLHGSKGRRLGRYHVRRDVAEARHCRRDQQEGGSREGRP